MPKILDLTGQRFGRLTVLSLYPERGAGGEKLWVCLCDCGKEKVARGAAMRYGNTRSCGCLQVEGRKKAHARNWDRVKQKHEERKARLDPEYGKW